MKKVLLDTSFILTSIRNKIDFIDEIKYLGLKILIPEQVINELQGIIKSKKKLKFKDEAELALKIIKKNKLKKINLKNKNTDKGIINYSKKDPQILVASLDKEIKKKTKNKKLIIRAKKKLEII